MTESDRRSQDVSGSQPNVPHMDSMDQVIQAINSLLPGCVLARV